MCDNFWQMMEKSQGDLSDIFQGSGFAGSATAARIPTTIAHTWQSSFDPEVDLPSSTDSFYDGFADTKDLMLHELAGTGFFGSTVASKSLSSMAISLIQQPSPPPPSPSSLSPPLVGLTYTEKVGGPSTRTPVIKRRKNQTRKVVCIPAPAVASNKPGGEVVPSDLWAWRKYGQKPIKGSPYPRGYYRCSSSKGCSARKQVERNRTDPSMLVITYTSDHNHPWPTQRNALSGSARSQSSKNNNNASSSKSSSINQKHQSENMTIREQEEAKVCPIISSESSVAQHFDNSIYELEPDDFFADLAIIDEEKNNSKAMDPYNMVCWDGRNSLRVTKGS